MPDNLEDRNAQFEEAKVSVLQWTAVIAEFYDALKGSGLPDEVCTQIVIDWAAWQWGPEEDGED